MEPLDEHKTKEEMIQELEILRRRVARLETLAAEHERGGQALHQSEERWRTYIEQANDLIFTLNPSGQITSANQVACTTLGYSTEELIGRSPLEIVSPQDRDRVAAAMKGIFGGQDIGRLEVEAHTKDGHQLCLEVRGRIIYQEGQVTETFHIARDITARKKVQEALRQANRKLQARNEELDAFARTVTHGLKNPLNATIGFAEMLETEGAAMPDEQVHEYARSIAENAHKMQRIIDALLRFALVREAEIELLPLDMAHIVSGAHLNVAHMLEASRGKIVIPDTWPSALGYEPWVEEIWENYISNAIKYGGRPPRIELGASVQNGGMVQFWVRDNGPGLAEEDQTKLFTPFTRLQGTRAAGHGLGLSIAKRIVEKLGGQVGIESEPGQGSTFIFSLPATPAMQRDDA